jgi:hypothetical protein
LAFALGLLTLEVASYLVVEGQAAGRLRIRRDVICRGRIEASGWRRNDVVLRTAGIVVGLGVPTCHLASKAVECETTLEVPVPHLLLLGEGHCDLGLTLVLESEATVRIWVDHVGVVRVVCGEIGVVRLGTRRRVGVVWVIRGRMVGGRAGGMRVVVEGILSGIVREHGLRAD